MVKLSNRQREEIKTNKHFLSISSLASHYEVSRRTIQFILEPVREAAAKLNRKNWKNYYKKENQARYTRAYRNKLKKEKEND